MGNDLLMGGSGRDELNGGDGEDTIDYYLFDGGCHNQPERRHGQRAVMPEGDTESSDDIENVRGSMHDDDIADRMLPC